jgi:hypothetical protein
VTKETGCRPCVLAHTKEILRPQPAPCAILGVWVSLTNDTDRVKNEVKKVKAEVEYLFLFFVFLYLLATVSTDCWYIHPSGVKDIKRDDNQSIIGTFERTVGYVAAEMRVF